MLLKKLLRSPLIPMSLFTLLITFLLLSITNSMVGLARLCFGVLVFCTFLWLFLLKLYNRKHPDSQIKPFGLIPPEFREMDEGQQWVTYRACRNVYIYYSFALPIVAGICFLFSGHLLIPICSIGALGIGQYLVYWFTTYRILKRVE